MPFTSLVSQNGPAAVDTAPCVDSAWSCCLHPLWLHPAQAPPQPFPVVLLHGVLPVQGLLPSQAAQQHPTRAQWSAQVACPCKRPTATLLDLVTQLWLLAAALRLEPLWLPLQPVVALWHCWLAEAQQLPLPV